MVGLFHFETGAAGTRRCPARVWSLGGQEWAHAYPLSVANFQRFECLSFTTLVADSALHG